MYERHVSAALVHLELINAGLFKEARADDPAQTHYHAVAHQRLALFSLGQRRAVVQTVEDFVYIVDGIAGEGYDAEIGALYAALHGLGHLAELQAVHLICGAVHQYRL